MAQKVNIVLVSDLSGEELADGKGETVSFALDGTTYEMDLSNKEADKFRGLFQDYIAAARKAGRTARKATGRGAQSGPAAKDVREWANANGFTVPERGRIPSEVREAYEAAH